MNKKLNETLCLRFLEWIDRETLDRLDEELVEVRAVSGNIPLAMLGPEDGFDGPLTVHDLRALHTMLTVVSDELERAGLGARDKNQQRRLGRKDAETVMQ